MTAVRKNLIFFTAIPLLALLSFLLISWYETSKSDLPYYGKQGMESDIKKAQEKNIPTVPAFSFINQDGEEISESFVRGKIWVADFFFTRCQTICPKMSNNLRRV